MLPKIDYRQLRVRCELSMDAYRNEPNVQARESDWGTHLYIDNGSDILAIAHLDTVQRQSAPFMLIRDCIYPNHAKKVHRSDLVYAQQLDDRLGAYLILDYLPLLGMKFDVLLTEHEEQCSSTAQDFIPHKMYKWGISFDRGYREFESHNDVVLYNYEDRATRALVEASGARVGYGSYSCICELADYGFKCFNWGVGYRAYHSREAHVYTRDIFENVKTFQKFYAANCGTHLPHIPTPTREWKWNTPKKKYKSDKSFPIGSAFDDLEQCPVCQNIVPHYAYDYLADTCKQCLKSEDFVHCAYCWGDTENAGHKTDEGTLCDYCYNDFYVDARAVQD